MKVISLSQGLYAKVSDADYERVFNFGKWYAVKNKYTFYAATMIGTRVLFMHSLLMGSIGNVDHIDRDGLNNQKENLRVVTASQNMANKRTPRNNSSGYKGVSLFSATGKWHAQIGVNKKRLHLGFFNKVEDAARAYNEAAKHHFGSCASLNEIKDNSLVFN
jgi:hypothetical protein